MPVVDFDLRGAGKIPAEQKAIAAATEKTAKSNEKLGQTWKSSAAEAKKYDRLAMQIVRNNETAQERYNRKLGETKRALAGNAREQDLLKKETTKLRLELLREVDANKKVGKAREKSAKRGVRELQKLKQLTSSTTKLLGKQSGKVLVLNNRFKDTGKVTESAFGSAALTRLATYGAGILSIGAGVRGITEEIRKQQELVDKAVSTQLSVSESRNVVLRNTISQTPAERKRILDASQQIARDTGVSEVAINAGLAQALSASGGKVDPSLAAVRVAAQFLSDRPSEIGEASGSLLDLSKVTGTTDAQINLGLLTKVGELGRVVNPRLQAQNIAPALIGAQSFGATPQGSGALFAALSNAGADVIGRRTGTAEIALAQQLSEFDFGSGAARKSQAVLQARSQTAAEQLAKGRESLSTAQASVTDSERRRQQSFSRRINDGQTRLDRAREDRNLAKTAAQKRAADRRVSDAEQNLTRLQADQTSTPSGQRIQGIQDSISESEAELAKANSALESGQAESTHLAGLANNFRGSNLTQRIQFLQKNPDRAQQFLGSSSFEKKVLGPIQDLLTNPNSQAAREFNRNLGLIPDNEGLKTVGVDALGVFGSNSLEPVAERKRRLGSAIEQLRVNDRGSVSAEEREGLKEILGRVGTSALGSSAENFLLGLGDGGRGLTEQSLLRGLEGARTRVGSSFGAPIFRDDVTGDPSFPGQLTPEEQKSDEILKSLIEALKENLQTQDQSAELEKQTELLEQLVDKPGGLVGVAN